MAECKENYQRDLASERVKFPGASLPEFHGKIQKIQILKYGDRISIERIFNNDSSNFLLKCNNIL